LGVRGDCRSRCWMWLTSTQIATYRIAQSHRIVVYMLYIVVRSVTETVPTTLLRTWERELRCGDLSSLHLYLLDRLFSLVVNDSLLLEVFNLRIVSSAELFVLPCSLASSCAASPFLTTYPTMCAVFFELLIQLGAERLCLFPARFCVYAVQNVVLVETFEEGVACCVALLSGRS
jgi:hypothetical protein